MTQPDYPPNETSPAPAPPPPVGEPTPGAQAPTMPYATPMGNVYQGPEPDKDSRTMAMLCHLLAIFTGFIGPLVIWLIKKDQSPFVNDQGKESLNFQITMLIAHLIGAATWCIFIGILVTPALIIVNLIFCIMGTMAANDGKAYRYPFALRLIQ